MKSDLTTEQVARCVQTVKQQQGVTDAAALYNKSEKVRKQGGEETCDVYITVPEEPKLLNNWVVLKQKKTQTPLMLEDGSAVITDKMAQVLDLQPGDVMEIETDEGWRAVFSGEPSVGGRFSALSVFGLLPAALVGIDLKTFVEHGAEAERICSEDAIDNPAIGLAAFLYDNYLAGRNKFSFLTQKRGRVLGLWIEQLVAESLGKHGQGILPNIEIDSLLLTKDSGDRTVVMYQTRNDLWDERHNFEMSMS